MSDFLEAARHALTCIHVRRVLHPVCSQGTWRGVWQGALEGVSQDRSQESGCWRCGGGFRGQPRLAAVELDPARPDVPGRQAQEQSPPQAP